LLVDGMGAFRQVYEAGVLTRWFDVFQSIASEGRPVGVHVVVSADRTGAVPIALASVIQRRLVLRLANETEYLSLGVPSDVLGATSPPGRGIVDDDEVQVAVLGGSANTARQAMAIARLAVEMESFGRSPAPAIERLTDQVSLETLPASVDGGPVLGLSDETLAPLAYAADDVLLVVGPPGSGKTTTLASIAASLRGFLPGARMYLGAGRSPLRSSVAWDETAVGLDDVAALSLKLCDRIANSGGVAGVFIDDISAYVNTSAESALLELIKVCRGYHVLLGTDGETASMGSWPLQMAVKGARHGIALQPDQIDGDTVFKTPFPRAARAEFPAGRGFYVRGGLAHRVQVALPPGPV
jgi:S-DNA-T family DNA segregation ATPase FtsK/SpoIIIE